MNFISLSPQTNGPTGHFFIYQKSIEKILKEAKNLSYKIYIAKENNLTFPSKNWVPHYKARVRKSKFLKIFQLAYEHFLVFFKNRKKKNTVFLESFGTYDFFAFFIAAYLGLRKKNKIWLMFRYDLNRAILRGKPIYFFVKLLERKFKTRLLALTETNQLVDELKKNISSRILIVPIPYARAFPERPFQPEKNRRLWWPGRISHAKGMPEIKKIIGQKLNKQNRFVISLSEEFNISKARTNIEYLEKNLSEKSYQEQMEKSDAILLPYHETEYRVSISGIFVETIIAGKLPFVKEGTWLAEELKKYNLNELILNWDQLDIYENILFYLNSKVVWEKYQKMVKLYRKTHNQKNLANILLQELRST